MVELMAVVAITVILFALSMVGVIRYQGMLKLTELDNAAREIYMAAENRAVLLSGSRRLNNQVGQVGQAAALSDRPESSRAYYVSKAGATNELLAAGSIDPALLDGERDFYIVYDLNGGSVTDVFYAESSMDGLVGSDFSAFYTKWARDRSTRLGLKNEMLVGYYNGLAAEGEDLDVLNGIDIHVLIENKEKLTVTVEYTLPESGMSANLSVKLGSIDLMNTFGRRIAYDMTGTKYSYTWVLDSLEETDEDGKVTPAKKFKDLNSGITPGGDFTVEATVTSPDGSFATSTARDEDNSLFREKSSGDTAYIKYLRHLQNLDAEFSGVTGKTAAVQDLDSDILCTGNETYGDYDFIPIINPQLESYDGQENVIRGLYVSGTKAPDRDAGLFSKTTGGTGGTGMTFENIRLSNASVSAAEGRNAGALVGSTSDSTIDNCWVYWEPYGELTDLRTKLGSDAEGDQYHYQISGKNAGGLAGYVQGNCTITDSLAATLVEGTSRAGGLVGQFNGSDLTVSNSYADCYLKGVEKAAGLVGEMAAGDATLTDCYAAGYIEKGTAVAGLCAGTGSTTATNVYSVMRFLNSGEGVTIDNLAQSLDESSANTYFLGSGTNGLSYETMVSDDFITTMGGSTFARKTGDSHPYNLRDRLTLTIYSYPGLKNLPHYGDWTAQFKEPSLVYYEQYGKQETDWGVSGGNARDLVSRSTLSDQRNILTDGYGVAFLITQEIAALEEDTEITVQYTFWDGSEWKNQTENYIKKNLQKTWWKNEDGSSAPYYLIPLPKYLKDSDNKDMVDSDYAEDCFYRYLSFKLVIGGTETASGRYFFNPHFAETVSPLVSEGEGAVTWNEEELKKDPDKAKQTLTAEAEKLRDAMSEVKIRTPRHLYDLSAFEQYYNRKYTFHQILDLDYSKYTGYSGKFQAASKEVEVKGKDGNPVIGEDGKPVTRTVITASHRQDPIGSLSKPFIGSYEGGCNKIIGVIPKKISGDQYGGLFGYSAGTLRNIVYEMQPEETVEISLGNVAQSLYVGALVGGNAGTMRNCAVYGINLRAAASGVTLYVGGLAGQNTNSGTIRNCEAEFASLSADCLAYASVYVGGLVGQNAYGCTVSSSYAVGRISAVMAKTVPIVRVCGFVGWNYGAITSCYTAADLQASGEHAELYGFCGNQAGSLSNVHYLNKGNFIYRDVSYAADYLRKDDTVDASRAKTYTNMTEQSMAGGLGMSWLWTGGQPDPDQEFPYPAVITDAEGKTVHYGDWPKPLPLGAMGVFYWEKMVDAADGKSNPTYHLSSLAVNEEDGKTSVTKHSTLSEAHDDGRVVVDYGYGYYARKDSDGLKNEDGTEDDKIKVVQFSATNIGYTGYLTYGERKSYLQAYPINLGRTRDPNSPSDKREIDAENGLAELMDEYTFHCWNTYREAPKAANENSDDYRKRKAVSGLYLYKASADTVKLDPNSGSFTLSQGATKVEFCINPQFADSMSVKTADITLEGGATTTLPGVTETNPYQVRSGLQLQDINWYDTAYTDVPVGLGDYSIDRFPYLNKKYYWKQTHDIDWDIERKSYKPENRTDNNGTYNNENGVFFPIAQGFVRNDTGTMSGGFSGTYNGGSYTLKNFNIGINEYNYQINTMGLFGYMKNAVLTDIVMFSESGNDVVTVGGRLSSKHDDAVKLHNNVYGWYAGGVLAGVAENSTISNCAVAGYTIVDQAGETRLQVNPNDTTRKIRLEFRNYDTYVDMGGAIGGLVGMTDKELSGCTAIVKININTKYNQQTADGTWTVPLRVGGLVGSTTANVTNCYTGGTININNKNLEAYVGLITGGVGMVTKDYYTRGTPTIRNCYSYMEVNNGREGFLFAKMNGNYGGWTTRENNYYLGTPWRDDISSAQEASITYLQLANKAPMNNGQTIYQALGSRYNPVTSVSGGLEVSGRYSYAPDNRKDLVGMDYPFPTVLTMDGNNVHYGAWELYGIYRPEDGGQPVELDMFTKTSGTVKLKLSDGINGGTWSVDDATVTVTDAEGKTETVKVATGKFDGKLTTTGTETTLTVTPERAWPTPVTLTVHCKDTDKGNFELPIKVYITDELELRPTTAKLFPGDTISLALNAVGFSKTDNKETDITNGTLTVTTVTDTPLTASQGNSNGPIKLERGYEAVSDAIRYLDLPYKFTSAGDYSVNRTHRLAVDMLPLPKATWTRDDMAGKQIWTMDFGAEMGVKDLQAKLWDNADAVGFTVKVEGTSIVLTKNVTSELTKDSVLTISFTLDGTVHTLKVPLSNPESVSAAAALSEEVPAVEKAPVPEAETGEPSKKEDEPEP